MGLIGTLDPNKSPILLAVMNPVRWLAGALWSSAEMLRGKKDNAIGRDP